ncbi:hypothetical protein RZS08_05400, partial [Arthrospira platensis SPKY1]|nr:hypothetical protein [Arthrospira platensis SPKY1]
VVAAARHRLMVEHRVVVIGGDRAAAPVCRSVPAVRPLPGRRNSHRQLAITGRSLVHRHRPNRATVVWSGQHDR